MSILKPFDCKVYDIKKKENSASKMFKCFKLCLPAHIVDSEALFLKTAYQYEYPSWTIYVDDII